MNEPIILVCRRVRFFSTKDEDMFFAWLKKIKCITSVIGKTDTIQLHIPDKNIKDAYLRELVALFRRYDIDKCQLLQLVNDDNRELFEYAEYGTHFNMYPAQPYIAQTTTK